LQDGLRTIALLPGSRPNEVKQILPTLVQAAARLAERGDVQFLLARAPNLDQSLFAPVAGAMVPIAIVEGRTDDALASAEVVVTASGTATVQAALHDCPMVIVYRLSPLTYRLGKRFVTVDTYGMVNLIAGRRVAPELIQQGLTVDAVVSHVRDLLDDPAAYAAAKLGLREVRARLGTSGASRRAAEAVLAVARMR
jgi:lipid-A-disaccharide synthase